MDRLIPRGKDKGEKGAFRGKTNKLNTKIKIVTFMVKKEDEFFFNYKSSQRTKKERDRIERGEQDL